MSSQPAAFSKGATFPPESARGLPRTLFSDVYGYCAGTIWHRSVVAAFAFLQFGPDTVASDGGASSQKSIEQRVPIGATACHLGGVRPWFICSVYSNGHHCGRRAAILYCTGDLFACRRCYDLSYASQQQTPLHRRLEQALKIRMRLGGGVDLLEPFPARPKECTGKPSCGFGPAPKRFYALPNL